ncbi:hypothetical protein LXA43DRAFT_313262 [Ganoderma leucocontextum]|nr:hypothetical protein LXA43DRAFT_313262 [Ganoderma leucocontextum]
MPVLFSILTAATAFSSAQAATPTAISPTSDETIGASIDFKYLNPDRTETNTRFESILIVPLGNSTINKAFPSPKFSDDDSTTAAATLAVDASESAEGDYTSVVLENGPSGSVFSTDFPDTLNFGA